MRILLTGGTGFVGGRLLPLLRGQDVLCLTRHASGLAPIDARVLAGDMMEAGEWLDEVIRFAPHWCIHAGWQGLPDYSHAQCKANFDASLRLFRALSRARVQRIVVLGTCWEYGDASGAVSEERVGANCGLFATAKHELHMALKKLAGDAQFEYRWLRLFFVYGPGQRATSLIPSCHAAYCDGREPEIKNPQLAQDFIHVDDVARGIWAVTKAETALSVFNVGTGKLESVGNVVNQVARHFGGPAPYSSSQPISGFWADMTRITNATRWQPNIAMPEGVERTLAALDRLG